MWRGYNYVIIFYCQKSCDHLFMQRLNIIYHHPTWNALLVSALWTSKLDAEVTSHCKALFRFGARQLNRVPFFLYSDIIVARGWHDKMRWNYSLPCMIVRTNVNPPVICIIFNSRSDCKLHLIYFSLISLKKKKNTACNITEPDPWILIYGYNEGWQLVCG